MFIRRCSSAALIDAAFVAKAPCSGGVDKISMKVASVLQLGRQCSGDLSAACFGCGSHDAGICALRPNALLVLSRSRRETTSMCYAAQSLGSSLPAFRPPLRQRHAFSCRSRSGDGKPPLWRSSSLHTPSTRASSAVLTRDGPCPRLCVSASLTRCYY